MGRRRSREFISQSCESFEHLSVNFRRLDKLRLDLERTYVKQRKILQLIRNEIPDAADHRARNNIQQVTNEVRRLLARSEAYLTLTCDFEIRRYLRGKYPSFHARFKLPKIKIEADKKKKQKTKTSN